MGKLAPLATPGTPAYDDRIIKRTNCDRCRVAEAKHVTIHKAGELAWCGHCYVKHQPR